MGGGVGLIDTPLHHGEKKCIIYFPLIRSTTLPPPPPPPTTTNLQLLYLTLTQSAHSGGYR